MKNVKENYGALMKRNGIKIILFCFLILCSLGVNAQPGDQSSGDSSVPLDETASDAAAAPIDDYVIPMVLCGIFFSFRSLNEENG